MGDKSEPRWLTTVLRPITEVRQGEAITALMLTLNVFLLLSAYYIIKPVREALILAQPSGAEYKAYMSGVIAILLLFAVPAYARFVDKLPRIKLVIGVTLFFATHLLLFMLAMQVPSLQDKLGLVFYAWVGVFNMMVVAQFWSFANDLYDEERGTRLIPMVALGASVGAAAGSQLSAQLLPLIGVGSMLLVAMGMLALCALLFFLVEQREGGVSSETQSPNVDQPGPEQTDDAASHPEPTKSKKAAVAPSGAFALVFNHRYLRLVAAFSLLFTLVNTNGEYMLSKLIKADAAEALAAGAIDNLSTHIGATYASFFFYVNVVGVLLQSFVVARLVRFLGFRLAFLVLPIIALGDAVAVAAVPALLVITIGKTAENATDYSLNNTLRQMLWLVTSREMKYKAKQAIDTFFVRMGDVSSALLVWLGATFLTLEVRHFAIVNIVLIAIWLLLAVTIGREHDRLKRSQPEVSPD